MSDDQAYNLENGSDAHLRLLESIVDNATDVILVTEAEPINEPGPRIVYVNESFTHTTGYAPEEVIGKTPRILQGPKTDRSQLDKIRQALSTQEPVRVELLNYRKDGTEFWVEVSIVPASDEHGRTTHYVSIQRDVTERKQQQEALKESEERLRTILVQYASDVITILEANGTIRYESPAVERTLGYKPEELVGKNILDYVHPEDVEGAVAELATIRNSPEARGPVEVRFRHKDGSWRYLEGVGNNLINDPEVGGVVINSRDVTGRRRAERRLVDAEEKYRTLVEQMPAIIYIHEPTPTHQSTAYDYEVSYISPQVEEVLGYRPQEFVQNRALWNDIIHPDDRAEVLAEDERTDDTGDPFLMEYRMVCRDGRVVWVREEAFLVHSAEGAPLYWQGVLTDVTKQKLAEKALTESERRFRSVVQNSSEVVKITDADGTLKYASPAFGRIFGYEPEEVIGTNVFDYAHPEDIPRIQEETEKALQSPGADSNVVEYRFRHRSGSWLWVESVGTYLLDDPAIEGVVINVRDVTERKEAEKELRLKDRAVASSSNGMIITDPSLPDNPIIYVNPTFERITGYTAGEAVGRNCRFLRDLGEEQPKLSELRRALQEGREWSGTLRNYRKDGETFWNELYIAPVHDGDGQLTNYIGVQKDVTERWKLERDLEHRATHDPLTGLANRRLLFERLADALESLENTEQRDGSLHESLCLLYMDLDGFKETNDQYGHEIGDALLAAVAGRIEGCLRPSDTAARVGGDEFCVLLEGASATEEAARVAERLVASLEAPFSIDTSAGDTSAGNLAVEISASIGIAVKDKDSGSHSPDELMREADTAMYRAKETQNERDRTFYEVVELREDTG